MPPQNPNPLNSEIELAAYSNLILEGDRELIGVSVFDRCSKPTNQKPSRMKSKSVNSSEDTLPATTNDTMAISGIHDSHINCALSSLPQLQPRKYAKEVDSGYHQSGNLHSDSKLMLQNKWHENHSSLLHLNFFPPVSPLPVTHTSVACFRCWVGLLTRSLPMWAILSRLPAYTVEALGPLAEWQKDKIEIRRGKLKA
jgi:hypothetical protein